MNQPGYESAASDRKVGAVLVIGGGIGGMQASLDLAELGYKVYLLETSPTIGGRMAQLDKTFPTNDCAMCIMSPKLVACGRHLNIEILTNSELTGVRGQPGNFEVSLLRKPRYVDASNCTGCGICAQHCPVEAISEYDQGLSLRAAIYLRYPQAVPLVYAIDRDKCIGCGLCENICQAQAVNYRDNPEELLLNIGAIILAPGQEEFEARVKGEYGYKRYANVITSVEFERMLSASGPYRGKILRPSDGEMPRKIAFIQCVGSRDVSCDKDYCSSVCCMYATKEALIAKEHVSDIEPTIFFMDVRAQGKDFDRYYETAKAHGVRYIRSQASTVKELPRTKNLTIQYVATDGTLKTEEFDLVVLSVGLKTPQRVLDLSEKLTVATNVHGFCQTDAFAPVDTSRAGVFVCGAFREPKDIPETVMEASGAAAKASSLLAPERGSLVKVKEYPPEIGLDGAPPRIGVFVCRCGINIGGVVDVPGVVEFARTLPNVVYTEESLYTCSQDTQERMKDLIKEHDLNRVVVASCSPRTHEPLFQETIREAGLNPYLFEMANIRDQCSWVHMYQHEAATEKAKYLVRMGVARSALLEPLPRLTLPNTHRGLVIGGGVAGMVATLSLAEQGFEVDLVEKEAELGGNARHIYYTLQTPDVQKHLAGLIRSVQEHPRAHVYLQTEVAQVSGYVGNFKTTLRSRTNGKEPAEVELEHGAIIVATGAEEFVPTEYLYGQHPAVVTQRELEERLVKGNGALSGVKDVMIIQCVQCRITERPYCSRVCCASAVKNALRIKQERPEANVYILYKDMRTYGFREEWYTEARRQGVVFIRYEDETKPTVQTGADNRLWVEAFDPTLRETLVIEPDLVALSAPMIPAPSNPALAQMLKVPLNSDGFFLEAHMKLRPVEFATEGIFLCGLAHCPKDLSESIAQAYAAASRAAAILTKSELQAEGVVSFVDADRCGSCKICVSLCPYEAMGYNEEEKHAQVNEALCKGCGTCAAACPSGAATINNFKDPQIFAQVEAALR